MFKNKELLERLKTEYNRVFPKSECYISYGSLCPETAFIKLYLSNGATECVHNIRENDVFSVLMLVTENEKAYEIECDRRCFLTRPKNPMFAYSSRRIPFRRTSSDENGIEKVFSRFVWRLHDALLEEYNNHNICVQHMEIVAQKLGVEL